MKRIITTAAALAVMAGLTVSAHAFSTPPAPHSAQSPITKISDGAYYCDWFAIFTCSRSRGGAQAGANKYGGYVIDTDEIDGFSKGWYCSVKGPSSKSKARQNVKRAKRKGASSAYHKKGCGDFG